MSNKNANSKLLLNGSFMGFFSNKSLAVGCIETTLADYNHQQPINR